MPLDRSEIEHMATLARIGLTQEELEQFQEQISNVLEQFQVLSEVDTTGVPPTGHAADIVEGNVEGTGGTSVMRDDESRDSSPPEEVLSNAPRQEGEFFRVNAVLEE